MLSSLADGEDKPERTLLELVLLAESQGYKQAEKVCTYIPYGIYLLCLWNTDVRDEEKTKIPSCTRSEFFNKNQKTSSSTSYGSFCTNHRTSVQLLEQNNAGGGGSRRRKSSAAEATAAAAAAVKAESIARAELEKRVESLERDLARAGQESRAQSARAASLQRQLDGGGNGGDQSGSGQSVSGGVGGVGVVVNSGGGGLDDVTIGVATADIMALKVKATQLVERLRHEKSARLKAERKTQKVAGKVPAAAAVVRQAFVDICTPCALFEKHSA